TKFCVTLVDNLELDGSVANSEKIKVYGFAESAIENTVDVYGVPGSGFQSLTDETTLNLIVSISGDGFTCKKSPADRSKLQGFIDGPNVYGFRKTAAETKGKVFALGDTDLSMVTRSASVSEGTTPRVDANACLVTYSTEAKGGFALTKISIKSNGTLNNSATLEQSVAIATTDEVQADFYINTSECYENKSYTSTVESNAGTQPYISKFIGLNAGDSITLVSTEFKVKANATLAALGLFDSACIQLFPTSEGDTKNRTTKERSERRVFEFKSKLTGSFTDYTMYLQQNADSEFDGFIKALSGSETCSSEKDGYGEEDLNYTALGNIVILPNP
ncbi:hypothetical protein N9D31_04015, partial [Oligoflexaceae bacterium]|nr:hypothetical protein [Oligoflexaceae bacterium]